LTQRHRSIQVTSLAGMIIVLLLAFGLDRVILFLKEENARTFASGYALLWTYVLANLALAICLLLLFWIVAFRSERSKLVAVIFLIIGVSMLLAPVLYFMPAFAGLNLADYLLPDKLLYQVGAFMAAIGLLSLILPRQKIINS
jgi:hypothetical protein